MCENSFNSVSQVHRPAYHRSELEETLTTVLHKNETDASTEKYQIQATRADNNLLSMS